MYSPQQPHIPSSQPIAPSIYPPHQSHLSFTHLPPPLPAPKKPQLYLLFSQPDPQSLYPPQYNVARSELAIQVPTPCFSKFLSLELAFLGIILSLKCDVLSFWWLFGEVSTKIGEFLRVSDCYGIKINREVMLRLVW